MGTHGADEAIDALLAARIPVSEVNDLARFVADPHVRARASVATVDDPELGELRMPAPAPRLSETPGVIDHSGPALGEHTEPVLREWLRATDDELAALRETGAL